MRHYFFLKSCLLKVISDATGSKTTTGFQKPNNVGYMYVTQQINRKHQTILVSHNYWPVAIPHWYFAFKTYLEPWSGIIFSYNLALLKIFSSSFFCSGWPGRTVRGPPNKMQGSWWNFKTKNIPDPVDDALYSQYMYLSAWLMLTMEIEIRLMWINAHIRAANNSRSSDNGQPKFANVQWNPNCGRT